MPEMVRAVLNPNGPNFAMWFAVFGPGMNVPLKSRYPVMRKFGSEKSEIEVYMVNLSAMPLWMRARFADKIARLVDRHTRTFNERQEVMAAILRDGFPIRA